MLTASAKCRAFTISPGRHRVDGNYVKYLEVARDELMHRIGYSHDAMLASGFVWPVVEMKLRYLQPARLRQKLAYVPASWSTNSA